MRAIRTGAPDGDQRRCNAPEAETRSQAWPRATMPPIVMNSRRDVGRRFDGVILGPISHATAWMRRAFRSRPSSKNIVLSTTSNTALRAGVRAGAVRVRTLRWMSGLPAERRVGLNKEAPSAIASNTTRPTRDLPRTH